MALELTTSYLQDSLSLFRHYKKLAEGAMAQVGDEQLFVVPGGDIDQESNSIAVIVRHMAGNMRSRWTDFLTTDGEKPWRDRDQEFAATFRTAGEETRAGVMDGWESGWACLFGALEPLTDEDLHRTVTIRGEAHSVLQAINRQLAHYTYHIGQIVWLARHLNHSNWQALTVPRGNSAQFNQKVLAGELSQR
jgi:hypothetical protein